jgi:hypothetical protein
MNIWKWSNGEAYYKSARPEKNQTQQQNQQHDSQLNAINQSLEGYSRRENIDEKLSDREMMIQRGGNPFFQTSYINDVVTQDMYLKPINTTQGRIKINAIEE